MSTQAIEPTTIAVGERIRFVPQSGNRWWTVRASNERHIIATQPAPFVKDEILYTVVDLTGWTHTYNGVGPGPVRSSLNTLGGGYDLGPNGEGCEQMLEDLTLGKHELSHRRVTYVSKIEVSA